MKYKRIILIIFIFL